MAKKKTSVILPGGIQGLVHNLQSGRQPQQEEKEEPLEKENYGSTASEPETNVGHERKAPAQSEDEANKRQENASERGGYEDHHVEKPSRSSEEQPEKKVKETVQTVEVKSKYGEDEDEIDKRHYTVIKDNTEDSWQLFLDMAQKYKKSGGKLATIYIDPDLKSVLDRLKYAGPERLSTSAILSSIVARFVFDHEDKIREILFGGKLIWDFPFSCRL